MTDLICKIMHGSHLYGTNTENSDLDYKGIYLPSKKEYFTQQVKKCIDHSTNKSNTINWTIKRMSWKTEHNSCCSWERSPVCLSEWDNARYRDDG